MDSDDGDAAEHDPVFARRLADARPGGDALTRAVWRSRVANALFGEAEPVVVGRYRLDRQLGRGGGGSVFVAADPELHRDVAVKLIRCTSAGHRDRALAEARALAKLSHPNVVPVHDVGETADHVYLVMELLRGESLREFAGPGRTVRELVGAYRQAATGLAAAHAVGLVHRDFKPDNAMFGDDGRLRVVDFGLAIDAGAGAAAPVGTPRYMAPEQRAGTRADAAVDQYALGVALRDAVTEHGRREPAWLGRVVARATAERPDERYPAMQAFAAALGDDPRSRWRRRALIAVPLAVAIAGFGIGRGATTGGAETCAGGPAALASASTPARVDHVARRIELLGTPFAVATAPLVRHRLGELGEAWLTAHRQSCTAHQRGELSGELYDRSTVCLARSRIELGEAMELLAAATTAQLDTAVSALAQVDRAERCADPIALAAEANPQPTVAMRVIDQQIEIAAIHARGATGPATALARQAVAAARANGDPRLRARALLVLGHAYLHVDLDQAVAPLHEAMLLGLAAGEDDVAIEAYARHGYAFAQLREPSSPPAFDGLELARAIGQRAGDRGAFARALLSNNVGAVAMIAGDFARARTELARAVRDATAVTGPGAVELVITESNLALLTADPIERRRHLDAAVARLHAAVGPDHPETLAKRLLAISDGPDPAAVVDALAGLCRRAATLHPTILFVEDCALELAWQATAIGRTERARDAVTLVGGGRGAPNRQRRLVAAYATLARGTGSRALVDELAALARAEADLIERYGWYQYAFAADAELGLAAAARGVGDRTLAGRAAALAVRHLEQFQATTGMAGGLIERRLAWARELAAGR